MGYGRSWYQEQMLPLHRALNQFSHPRAKRWARPYGARRVIPMDGVEVTCTKKKPPKEFMVTAQDKPVAKKVRHRAQTMYEARAGRKLRLTVGVAECGARLTAPMFVTFGEAVEARTCYHCAAVILHRMEDRSG